MKKLIFLIVFLILGCEPPSTPRPPRPKEAGEKGDQGSTSFFKGGLGARNTGLDGELESVLSGGKIELNHIVDPYLKSYRKKVTIPKNYSGYLYLSGINIRSLSTHFVKVRFKFGRHLSPITIRGVIAKGEVGEGPTPQTDRHFIVLDLKDQPFQRVRNFYNLFDYNNYFDEVTGQETKEPVTDPRDLGLYCRGLDLPYDPTFEGTRDDPLCDQAGEQCLYAYAKIRDKGLVEMESGHALVVDRPQMALNSEGSFSGDSGVSQLMKCLPDNTDEDNLSTLLGITPPLGGADTGTMIYEVVHNETGLSRLHGSSHLENHTLENSYTYRGPFKAIGVDAWKIGGQAIFSLPPSREQPTGIFRHSLGGSGDVNLGYESFLFPRAVKMDLKEGMEHMASSEPFSPRTLRTTGLSGETEFMDGCSGRMRSYNREENEDISSCNVTATIEILLTNSEGHEVVVARSIDLKLQLIRPSEKDDEGRESLAQSLHRCFGPGGCASDECCFNNQCWSKQSVGGRCLDENNDHPQKSTGERCQTDYECASLCCNESTSLCAVHMNKGQDRVLCSKAPGQTCVGQEWCRKDNITQCFKVSTGISATGQELCALRCYNVPAFGTCVAQGSNPSQCRAPSAVYKHVDMSDCQGAIEPPGSIGVLKNMTEGGEN